MIPGSPIAGVRWRPWCIPFVRPFEMASAPMAEREGVVVVLETDDGAIGIGEASPLPSLRLSVATVEARLGVLAPPLVGRSPTAAWAALPPCGQRVNAVDVALETALGDLIAQGDEVPIGLWLAQQAGLGPPAGTPIAANALLTASDPSEVAREAKVAAAEGFDTFKLKVGRDLTRDHERLAAVRAALGPEAVLRIDANGAWAVEEAVPALTSLAVHDIALCEQPVPAGSAAPAQLAEVRAASPVPIAADESCGSGTELSALIAANAVDAVVVKPLRTGLRAALAMIAIARSHALRTVLTTTFDTGIGTALALHLAALLPEPRPACGLATRSLLAGDVVSGFPALAEGAIAVPSSSGLGVRLDPAALDRFAIGPWTDCDPHA